MFNIVFIYVCGICVVRRIDIDALYLPSKFTFQCFQCQQIIPMDQHILRIQVGGGIGKLCVFNK